MSDLTYVRKGVEFLGHRHRCLVSQMREANVYELLRIDGSMVVAAFAHIAGQRNTRSVRGLPNIKAVHSARDFSDQDGRQSLRSELLVNAQEVDFCHLHGFVVDVRNHGDAGDKTDQEIAGGCTNSNVPIFVVSRRSESPLSIGYEKEGGNVSNKAEEGSVKVFSKMKSVLWA